MNERTLVAANDAYVFFFVEDYVVSERRVFARPTVADIDAAEEDAKLLLMPNWFPEQTQRDC